MKWYAALVSGKRSDAIGYFYFKCYMKFYKATSAEEAIGKAYVDSEKEYPRKDGWMTEVKVAECPTD